MNLVGQRLGKYQLSERLGQGGMAQVYKAYQPTIERFVAIKVMHSHLAESADFVERFKREARGLGQLRHPHIVNIIDFDVEDEYYYMVMDYIAGPTLSDVLQTGAFSLEQSLRVTGQLCDALVYAHERGTIHRDLKPANVMFVDDSLRHPVLTDFGIARLLDETALTASGALSGTPAYISPEAVKGMRVDGRADLYSLGIILYEMITGQPPYSGDTSWSVMMQHVNEPPPRLEQVKPDVPLLVANLIERAMAKPVEDRFQSAAEFRQAVREAEYALLPGTATEIMPGPLPTTLSPTQVIPEPEKLAATVLETPPTAPTVPLTQPATTTSTPPVVAEPAKRPFWWLLAGSALVLLLIGLGLIWWSGWPSTDLPGLFPPAEVETAEKGQFGLVRFHNTDDGHQLSLWLERAAQPPPGHHYAWWIRADDQRVFYLGRLPYENGRIQAVVHLDNNLLLNFAAALVTLEVDDQPVTTPSDQIAFQGELAADYIAQMNQLFVASQEVTGKAYFPAAQEQLGHAILHYEFLQQSLAEDDLREAKRHAEHVVNILDGEGGEFFGDIDGDGQVQNPGDGVGVRRYVREAAARIETAVDSLTLTPMRRTQATAATSNAERVLALSDALIGEALRLVASDTIVEAQTPADQMGVHVEELLASSTRPPALPELELDDGLMGSAVAYVLALSDVLLLPGADQPDLPAPEPLAAPDGRRGFFYPQPDNQFLLLLDQVPPAPAEMEYMLWAYAPDREQYDRLGTFTTTTGLVSLAGQSEAELVHEYSRIAISLESINSDGSTPTPSLGPGPIQMIGSFDQDLVNLIISLTTAASFQEKGALFGTAEQVELAAQHAGFMRQSLADDDLAEARRHAEHVVNILDGETGQYYGDVDGDGQVQNPGDGVGVRIYLERLIEEIETADSQFDLTANQQFYATLVYESVENGLLLTDAAINEALRLIAADTVAEAIPIAEATDQHLTRLVEGFDDEGDGLIDPLRGEGGLNAAIRFTYKLAGVIVTPVLP